MKPKILLYLDDYRNPFDATGWLRLVPIEGYEEVVWVKNFKEFVEHIQKHGVPFAVSFDHDLADEHMVDYHQHQADGREFIDYASFKEKTGLDCAKWLINHCEEQKTDLPLFWSHSANPMGRENILSLLRGRKFKLTPSE